MTRSEARRKLEELRTLYSVRPSLRDILVEGREDAGLIRWYLLELGYGDARVYAVDDRVDVPSAAVLETGGEVGARGRVLTIAEAAAAWELAEPSITCIVDLDRDAMHEESRADSPHLLRTDFGSMDVYGLSVRPLRKLISNVLGLSHDAEALIQRMVPALNEIFVIRYVLHMHGAAPLIRDFVACCDTSSSPMSVETDELLRRSLSTPEAVLSLSEAVSLVEETRARLPSDPLRAIRGHDMASMIIAALGLTNKWADPRVVERALRGCLEANDLHAFGLFEGLRARLAQRLPQR